MKFQHAFTLIEMLVVISIIAILSTMIFIAQERSEEEMIASDALMLQSTLDRARSLSISSGNSHGVAFHIENAGDGTVLKNKSVLDDSKELFVGRHWYCIIGPDKEGVKGFNFQSRKGELPPLVKPSHGGTKTFSTLQDYAEVFEKAQIGPRIYLSEGVRFLALSDYDEQFVYEYKSTYTPYGRVVAPNRPWFGWYDDSTNTLYPWGAYNRDIDDAAYVETTGLDYAGLDGEIDYDANLDTNVSPNEVWGRINMVWDFESSTVSNAVYSGATAAYPEIVTTTTKDNEMSNHYNRHVDFIGPDTEVLAGKKRPLVNAYWCDFMIYYLPSGAARVTTGHARHYFLNNNSSYGKFAPLGRSQMGIENQEDRVGGFTITICRDIDPEEDVELYPETNATTAQPAYNKFNSVEDAFDSITPFMRVFVDKFTGVSDIRTNDHPLNQITPNDLLQTDPYPRLP